MDFFLIYEIKFLVYFQKTLKETKEFFFYVSHMSDPRYNYSIIFPIVYFLDKKNAIKLLLIATCAEWINSILKWLLFGNRPYWWVHENKLILDGYSNQLEQYYLTCETGPGNPSGHVMMFCCVYFIIVKYFIIPFSIRNLKIRYINFTTKFVWLIYGLFITLVGLSRCFIAAHFPHQILFGSFIGLFLCLNFEKLNIPLEPNLQFFSIVSSFALFIAYLLHCVLQYTNINPDWSLELSKIYCINKTWLHIDTNILSSFFRVSGSLIGLGIGLYIKEKLKPSNSQIKVTKVLSIKVIYTTFIISLIIYCLLFLAFRWIFSTINITSLFYLIFGLTHASINLLVSLLVPVITNYILYSMNIEF